MHKLLTRMRGYFDALENRYATFGSHGVQLEWWFKGELLFACDELLNQGEIQRVDRDTQFEKKSKRKIDLVLETTTQRHWI